MISLHIHIVVPQTDQTRRTARPRPHIPPSRCTACPCRTQAIWRRMRRRSSLQAGKDKWARGDPRPSHARTDRCGKRGPEAEARGTETDRETRGIEVERNTHGTKARCTETRGTEAPKRACVTSIPDPGCTGETTDDGCTSPILRVSGQREQRVPQSAATAPLRPATVCFSHPHAVSEASPHTPSAAPGRHSVTVGAGNDGEAPNSAADGACDVFDSQCRRYHALALKATNIMKLLDLPWFRTECDHTLRTRLGAGLHCRDCFDLVSTYLLALKTR